MHNIILLKINSYFSIFKKIFQNFASYISFNLAILCKKLDISIKNFNLKRFIRNIKNFLRLDWLKKLVFYQLKLQSFKNSQLIIHQPYNFWLWVPFCFACGCIFYIQYSLAFIANFKIFLSILLISIIGYLSSKNRQRDFSYLLVIGLLSGSFFNYYYDHLIINYPEIKQKIIVQGQGKIVNIKKFYNPINHQQGLILLIENPQLTSKINYQLFDFKHNFSSSKRTKKKSLKPQKKIIISSTKDDFISSNHKSSDSLNLEIAEKKLVSKKTKKNLGKKTKQKDKNKLSEKLPKNFKNLVNLKDYMELDRKFLDYSNTPRQFENFKNNHFQQFFNSKNYILLTQVKDQNNFQVGDQIEFYSSLTPPKNPEFIDDYDPRIDAKFKKIFAFGYLIKAHRVNFKNHQETNNITGYLQIALINNIKELLTDLVNNYRKLIITKINLHLKDQNQAIALALLLGDQSLIDNENLIKIRQSGLTHLLSISGFHLSIAGLFCFISLRLILAYFPAILLRFNLKKISAIIAIVVCFFYLHLANAPIPAQRAFLAIFFVMVSYIINERIDAIRIALFGFMILVISNPYILFNISFQLSFVAILVMLGYYQQYHQKIFYPDIEYKFDIERKYFINKFHRKIIKFINYFREIFIVSTIIQIATLPYLMHSFRNFSLIASYTNIFAIPLTSLIIMPSGFLAMLLSLIDLEKIPLSLMNYGLDLLQIIIDFFSSFNFASFNTFYLNNLSIALVSFAIFLCCLTTNKILKFLSLFIFLFAFFLGYRQDQAKLIFNANQKISAIIDPQYGLQFSSTNRITKRHQYWLNKFQQKNIKNINTCDKSRAINNLCQKCIKNKYNDYCLIFYQPHKFLVIKNRSQIKKLCKFKKYSVINLTKKYQLPKCLTKNKNNRLIVDNIDFIEHQSIEVFIKNNILMTNSNFY